MLAANAAFRKRLWTRLRAGASYLRSKPSAVTWVYLLPPALVFAIVIVAIGLVSVGGLVVVRRIVPQSDELTHNDVAGPIIGTIGTILAVILSFLLVTVWQEWDGAGATVEQEGSAVADLYHIAANLPNPVGTQLRATLRTYVNAVADDEWPAMRTGGRSNVARHASQAALRLVAGYQPQTAGQQQVQQAAMTLAQTLQDSRRDRLFDNDQGIPIFFWVGNIVLAAITIGFCFLFRVRSFAIHVIMTLALSTVIGTIFVLIALFDYPFRGTSQIPPTIFTHLQRELPNGLTESD